MAWSLGDHPEFTCSLGSFVWRPCTLVSHSVHQRSLVVGIELRSSGDPVTSQTRVRLGGFLTGCRDLPDRAVGVRSLEACCRSGANGSLTFGMKRAHWLHPLECVSQSDPGSHTHDSANPATYELVYLILLNLPVPQLCRL